MEFFVETPFAEFAQCYQKLLCNLAVRLFTYLIIAVPGWSDLSREIMLDKNDGVSLIGSVDAWFHAKAGTD